MIHRQPYCCKWFTTVAVLASDTIAMTDAAAVIIATTDIATLLPSRSSPLLQHR